jgi:phage-related protein
MTLVEEFVGPKHRVCTLAEGGRNLTRGFLDGLQDPEQKKVRALLQDVADYGLPLRNRQKCKILKGCGNLLQLRASQARLFCFVFGRDVVVTHGFLKKRDPKEPAQIGRAVRMRDAWLAEQEGRR